jgi:16S rRNA pseudouridine516 synthase
VKLYRALQSQGFGTRRECIARVRAGEVAVDGIVCDEPEAEVDPAGLVLTLDDVTWSFREKAYLMLNKPAGYECSHQPTHHPSVFSLLPAPLLRRGVQCVGRLDEDTTGLLLFSDDGAFIHRLISPRKGVAKRYRVTCRHPVTGAMLEALRDGVQLRDEALPVAALQCERHAERVLLLSLAEGKYHQVKRMVAAAGNRVDALQREAIGGLTLPDDLPPGSWRWLDDADLKRLEGK